MIKFILTSILKEIGWFIVGFVTMTVSMWAFVGMIWVGWWVRTALGV